MDIDKVLEVASQEQIFECLLGFNIKRDSNNYADIYERYCNPFRPDTNPSCYFSYDYGGKLRFQDPVYRELGGDYVDLAKLRYKSNDITFVLNKLYEQLLIGNLPKECFSSNPIVREEFDFSYYEGQDYSYYMNAGISYKTLQTFNVKPCASFTTSTGFCFISAPYNPAFVYKFQEGKLLYLPNERKKLKWRYVGNPNVVQGFEQLPKDGGELLIITKSLKDCMVFYEYGLPAIAALSESVLITPEVVEYLKLQYDYVLTVMDNDQRGIATSELYFEKHDIKGFQLAYYKDCFEYWQNNKHNLLYKELCKKIKQSITY